MHLPFTIEQFLDVFAKYNTAIWPAQIGAYLLGCAAIVAALSSSRSGHRVVSLILAILWVWVGVVYHIHFFRQINPAALVFGLLFIAEGILFAAFSRSTAPFQFRWPTRALGITGSLFILYAMVIYPILGYHFGHVYPHSPMFGVTPCPLLLFTFGLLLWTMPRVPKYLFIIPAIWALVGVSAALSLGILEDMALPIFGCVTIVALIVRDRKASSLSSFVASTP